MLVVALNLRTLLGNFSVPWPVVTALYLALAAVWALVLVGPRRKAAAEARAALEPVEAEA
jgi:hypothetical protein